MAPAELTSWLAGRGIVTAAEFREGLGISRATLSRMVARAPDTVLRLGGGRSVRYALARRIGELPDRIPLCRIDEQGRLNPVAHISAISGGGTWVEPIFGSGHGYAGLPPALGCMAPTGYLGGRFARRHTDLGLPRRLEDWTDDQRLLALARRGEDSPGDLVLGDESADRFLARTPECVTPADFPRLAEQAALTGTASWIGGERPKFTAYTESGHCIVKFTPGDGTDADRRWRDLLVCESLALRTLASVGLPAAETSIVDEGARRFLVVHRFDRVGLKGRRGTLTLGPVDSDLFDNADTWATAADRLLEAGRIDVDDHWRIVVLDAFGVWIANGDRHFGNLSFFADGSDPRPCLRLAPAYDMVPMDLAPVTGIVPGLDFEPRTARANLVDVWDDARKLAEIFWTAVADDARISEPFREHAARRGLTLQ